METTSENPVPDECITAINRIICEVAQVFKVKPDDLFDAITKKGVPNFTELENAFTAQILTDETRRIKIVLLEQDDVGKKTFETFDKALNPEATAPVVDAATEATVVSAPITEAAAPAPAPATAPAPEATANTATEAAVVDAPAPTAAVDAKAPASEAAVVSAPAPTASEAAVVSAPAPTANEADVVSAPKKSSGRGGSNRITKKKRNHLRTTLNHRVRKPQ